MFNKVVVPGNDRTKTNLSSSISLFLRSMRFSRASSFINGGSTALWLVA